MSTALCSLATALDRVDLPDPIFPQKKKSLPLIIIAKTLVIVTSNGFNNRTNKASDNTSPLEAFQ
jgi:hypothetical protein